MINGAIRKALDIAQGKVSSPAGNRASRPLMEVQPPRSGSAIMKGKDRRKFEDGGPAEEQQTLPLRPYEPRYNPKSGKLDAADRKDIGFYGPVKVGPVKVASEYSADADIGQYPSIAADMPEHLKVQALNAARFDAQVPKEAAKFAYKKAKERISKKRSPFYEPGKDPYPEWSPEQHWEKPYGLKEDVKERAMGGRTPAWQRSEGKNPKGGLNAKGRASAKAEGHNLKPPAPHPKTDAAAARRKSFCSRMKGMKAKLTSSETANDPDSRINKSLRAWNCRADGGRLMDEDIANALRIANTRRSYDNGGFAAPQPMNASPMGDTSADDQDYASYIDSLLNNLANNSAFNTPPTMPSPQVGMPQDQQNIGMPPSAGMNMPPAPPSMPPTSSGTAPASNDVYSQLANAGFDQSQIGNIMQIMQGQQGVGQQMQAPFAPPTQAPFAPTMQAPFAANAMQMQNTPMAAPAAAPAQPASMAQATPAQQYAPTDQTTFSPSSPPDQAGYPAQYPQYGSDQSTEIPMNQPQ